MIYLDYAATSALKPEAVYNAAADALRNASGNPGRAGHRISLDAAALTENCRQLCGHFFHAESAERIVFCFNGTDALNLAIYGSVPEKTGHVITSSMEHNSVARPLKHLEQAGVKIEKLPTNLDTGVNPKDLERAICPNTKLVVINHISNVTGTVNDIKALGQVCKKHHVPFLVDAAQSAGFLPIDVQDMNIDLLAFPGHKGLYGPQGTGGLYVRPGLQLEPLKQGGTGSHSQLLSQPKELPDKYESGTLNVAGLAGLAAGVEFLMKQGIDAVTIHEKKMTDLLIHELRKQAHVTVYAPSAEHLRGPVISLSIENQEVQDAAMLLDQIFDIAVRAGLHCAPDAHDTIGTSKNGGTIRVSPGWFTTEQEIEQCVKAIGMIAKGEI